MTDPYWKSETTKDGSPMAVLYDNKKVVAKIYLSPDLSVLRIVLPEMQNPEQFKTDWENKLVDFKRSTK